MDLKNLLHNTPISGVKESAKPLITLKLSDSLLHAAQTLTTNDILACPVVDDHGHCQDVIDQIDLCVYTLNSLKMLSKDKQANIFSDTLATLIAARSTRKLTTMPNSSSLRDVVQALVSTHRVCIVDESGAVTDLITQSDICKLINRKQSEIGAVANQPIEQLLITSSLQINRNVFSVETTETAANAFVKLADMNVQGIAVVDGAGTLVSQLSAQSIRLCETAEEMAATLNVPVTSYSSTPLEDITISTSSTFAQLVSQLVEKSIHRGFIVDESGKPSGVLSMSDVMAIALGL